MARFLNLIMFIIILHYSKCETSIQNACLTNSAKTASTTTLPFLNLGEKSFYIGYQFKANFFKAMQFCRLHGMHLATVGSAEENDKLAKYLKYFGFPNDYYWSSGTDLGNEGNFYWLSTGQPLTYTNWLTNEPNGNLSENCLQFYSQTENTSINWNDLDCMVELHFICEVYT